MQINVVGKAETSFLPGVKIPSLAPTSLAAKSGLRGGDVILYVGDKEITSDPGQVGKCYTSHSGTCFCMLVQHERIPAV